MTETQSHSLRAEAERLALDNVAEEPSIEAVYWFPAKDEIRLIEVDATFPMGDSIDPFYFRADPANGTGRTSGIAMVRPEQVRKLSPPDGWGTWDEAKLLWRRENGNDKP